MDKNMRIKAVQLEEMSRDDVMILSLLHFLFHILIDIHYNFIHTHMC